ncbi:hypothetical protein AJ79_02121 [Helicocarpus griseus UAMH5409]|uniref:Aminoglycoside phosphotransferase domain-containing protein n=1 Tax=Helicocarpus griseus UAMH5409 TaxID=1447875 RepID=A0A2B7XW03_9EURO|nr:hypothetical protein AJ79_02121 [Helicocarpus griseus UAMH5409]
MSTSRFSDCSSSLVSSSDEQNQEELQHLFGNLLSIPDASFASLASSICRRTDEGQGHGSARVISRLSGSYNLIRIVEFDDQEKYVVRLPATGWGERFTESARLAFESQVVTMYFLREHTKIPVPEVYAFDASRDNEIGAPYIVMSPIPGETVASKWFSGHESIPIEEFRWRILDSVAEAVSELQKFRFDEIGSLQINGETEITTSNLLDVSIGPCHSYDEGIFGQMDYRRKLEISPKNPLHSADKDAKILVDQLISCLPQSTRSDPSNTPSPQHAGEETFVLTLPDFGPQNIMIDNTGAVTGIIDWDNTTTVPRFLGFISYPSWIASDWDPARYTYPDDTKNENSPEELRGYRRFYHERLRKYCGSSYEVSRLAPRAHIYEAIVLAAGEYLSRLEILKMIVGQACQLTEDKALQLIQRVGETALSYGDFSKLEDRFRAFLWVPP